MTTPDNEKHDGNGDGNNDDGDRDCYGDGSDDDDGDCDGDDGNDDDDDKIASAVQLQDLHKKELCGGEDPVEI